MSTKKSIRTRRAASNRLHAVAEAVGLAAVYAALSVLALVGCIVFD